MKVVWICVRTRVPFGDPKMERMYDLLRRCRDKFPELSFEIISEGAQVFMLCTSPVDAALMKTVAEFCA